LRERLDDLPLLADHFINAASQSLGKQKPSYPPELISLLSNYSFPGNVRELRAMIYDAVGSHKAKKLSMERFKTHIDDERAGFLGGHAQFSAKDDAWFSDCGPLPTLDQAKGLLIAAAMKRTNSNQSMAASLLGISRQRLARQLKSSPK
jgi:DNA-binding NtrC family response regulator